MLVIYIENVLKTVSSLKINISLMYAVGELQC